MNPFMVAGVLASLAAALASTPAATVPAPLHYRIDARLDASSGVLSGRETVTWLNGAAIPRTIAVCAGAGQRLATDGDRRAVLVAPGARATLDLQWTAALLVPGQINAIADHWYPRAALGADARDPACAPAVPGRTAPDDPADFEVSLAVPRGWLVGATGREEAAGADGTLHRFQQRGVREFSWVTGPQYLERWRRIDGSSRAIDVRLLLLPEHAAQAGRLLDAAADALAQHARWLSPYAADHLTLVDAGWRDPAGDRSYPGLITFATRWRVPADVLSPEAAIARGISGQWWTGAVLLDGDPRLGDGIADYFAGLTVEHLFDVRHQELAYSAYARSYLGGFLPWSWSDVRVPRASAHRARASRAFGTLERYLSAPVLQRALAAVIERHHGARLSRQEFFSVVGDAAGQDLRWFDEAVFAHSDAFDYAVGAVRTTTDATCGASPCFRTDIVLERRGGGQFTGSSEPPAGRYESGRALRLTVAFADGQRADDTWDGRARTKTVSLRSRAAAVSAHLDPEAMLLLDGARTNNSWTSTPRAGLASARWAATWLTWLQDCLLQYAALV